MKNLEQIPDTIISADEKTEFCEMEYAIQHFRHASVDIANVLPIIERLAGAYLDCLKDRDEWKELGEAVQGAALDPLTFFVGPGDRSHAPEVLSTLDAMP